MAIFEPFFYIIGLVADVYYKLVIIQIALYWLLHFNVIKVKNTYAHKTIKFLEAITEPAYKKIREKVKPFNGIDFSPLIFVLALIFISRLAFRMSELLI
ncbi:MAG: YggT family protein [Lactobacillaceae bacterium]|jgi:YggT family protein|nr:YggT family protein [Lactobacillaceae bacterium]